MPAAPHSAQTAPAQGRTPGLRAHIQNIYRLVIKELRSIRADPMMLVLVAYAFSVAVYMVATGASTPEAAAAEAEQRAKRHFRRQDR